MLALVVVAAVPVVAQTEAPEGTSGDQYEPESVVATGMIGLRTESTPWWYPNSFGITDYVSGTEYGSGYMPGNYWLGLYRCSFRSIPGRQKPRFPQDACLSLRSHLSPCMDLREARAHTTWRSAARLV